MKKIIIMLIFSIITVNVFSQDFRIRNGKYRDFRDHQSFMEFRRTFY